MNRNNLQRMIDHLSTVPEDKFDMGSFRSSYHDRGNTECNSVGCVIGHCTILAPELVIKRMDGTIQFCNWSKKFTGLDIDTNEWDWCFSGLWDAVDNTIKGAQQRIKYLLNGGEIPDMEVDVYDKEWIKLYENIEILGNS